MLLAGGSVEGAASSHACKCRRSLPETPLLTPPFCLHDAAGRQGVGDVAGAGRLAVLAHSLVAAAVGVPAPLHGPVGVGGQAAQDAGVDGQGSQAVVGEQHRLAAARGAGDELVLGAGLVEDLQTLLAHRVQAGEDARPLAGKVVGVAAGGAVQRLARHDGPGGGRGRGGGGGGGGGAQHVLVDDDVLHLVVELVVADLVGTGLALRQEALLPSHHGGGGGHHGSGGPCDVQGQVAAGLVDDDLALAAAVPRHSGRRGVAGLGDGHRTLPGELLRLDDLDGVHGDGDGLAPEAGHSHVPGEAEVWAERGCGSYQRWTPLPGSGRGETIRTLNSAIGRDMGADGCLHVCLGDLPLVAGVTVSLLAGKADGGAQRSTAALILL